LAGIVTRKVDSALANWIEAISIAVGPGGVVQLGNFPTGGSIGPAASTVDIASTIVITQNTAGQTLTVPALTVSVIGQEIEFLNAGTTSFTMMGKVVPVGSTLFAVWGGNNISSPLWFPQV
jgi:hypothetical protein